MAGRRHKIGLDYFELDCNLDNKIKLIQAEFGLKGFAVVVKLYQKIYGEDGYYCEWNDDALLLFMSENGLSGESGKNLVNGVISCCIRRGIFSEEIFDKYRVLTSAGVQKRYLDATSKRDKIELKKEYLLLSASNLCKNVVINSISNGINVNNDIRNTQSREEKRREEKSRVVVGCESTNTATTAHTFDSYDSLVKKYGKEFVDERVARAKKYKNCNMDTVRKWCEEDFKSKKKNSFNNFPQREYNYEQLEKELINRNNKP